jgi:hypothetical protein
LDAAWELQGELELRSRSPWNTIFQEEFMRGESADGRRLLEEEEVEWRCWVERTRRTRGGSAAESRERRGASSWSWLEEDDEEEREDAAASESEPSRRSGAEERSDDGDERPPAVFRCSRSFSDRAAADELVALAGGFADGDGLLAL